MYGRGAASTTGRMCEQRFLDAVEFLRIGSLGSTRVKTYSAILRWFTGIDGVLNSIFGIKRLYRISSRADFTAALTWVWGRGFSRQDLVLIRVKYARQHVKIVGFDNAAFKRALNVIHDVAYLLVTAVPAGQMEPWVPEIESDELGVSLVANCRYFTLGRDIRPEARMEFDHSVPHDIPAPRL
ncbi:hypothetical protein B0H13DRAFT_1854885 [Mycena leptocephala]|nr:hypothetical protein B0H13DRAFT_1854885 [Mycena leptocephala]